MSSSNSKSSAATTYSNADNRGVADGGSTLSTLSASGQKSNAAGAGAILVPGDRNLISTNTTTNYQTIDAGSVQMAGDTISKALDVVAGADATAGDGFERVITLAGDMMDAGRQMVADTQQAALSAYSQATTEKAGTIDNKTIIVLGIAGAAVAFALANGSKG
ncbi:MAG TPA: hypothetical protein VJ673_02715 [Aromatoleum sp.]|uniref:hypothetical protein n=1 Tax=Aromatoleum sp. TaxID=2307007 RepID=UPI002B481901|nr:hypothetical protein [Aromatoleum sp.]HJV24565.1 hypothetical protein [Aromatoleum sp.]